MNAHRQATRPWENECLEEYSVHSSRLLFQSCSLLFFFGGPEFSFFYVCGEVGFWATVPGKLATKKKMSQQKNKHSMYGVIYHDFFLRVRYDPYLSTAGMWSCWFPLRRAWRSRELKKRWPPSELTMSRVLNAVGKMAHFFMLIFFIFFFNGAICYNTPWRVHGEIAEGHLFLTTCYTVLKTHLTSSKSPLEVGRALTTMVLPLCSMGLTLHPRWLVDQQ